MPPALVGATLISRRTVLRPQPKSRRAKSALGIPIKTSGSASAQQRPRLRTADPWVNQNRHDTRFEQRERSAKKSRGWAGP